MLPDVVLETPVVEGGVVGVAVSTETKKGLNINDQKFK